MKKIVMTIFFVMINLSVSAYNFNIVADQESSYDRWRFLEYELQSDLLISRSDQSPEDLFIVDRGFLENNLTFLNNTTGSSGSESNLIFIANRIGYLFITANGFIGESGLSASEVCASSLSNGDFGQVGIDHIGLNTSCSQVGLNTLAENTFSCPNSLDEQDSRFVDIRIYSQRRHCKGIYTNVTCIRDDNSTYQLTGSQSSCDTGDLVQQVETVELDEFLIPSVPNCNSITPNPPVNRDITWIDLGINRNTNYPIETIQCDLDAQSCLDVNFIRTEITDERLTFNPTQGERGVRAGSADIFTYNLADKSIGASHNPGQGGLGGAKDLDTVELIKFCVQVEDADTSSQFGINPRITYQKIFYRPFIIGDEARSGEISNGTGKTSVFIGLDQSQKMRLNEILIENGSQN